MVIMKNVCGCVLILCVVVVLIAGCGVNRFAELRPISHVVVIDSLRVGYRVDKISYSPMDRTFFLLNRDENIVRIYQNGVFFNRIGGVGFGDDNFRGLSDIAVGFDGHLYTLDRFDKSIKRFCKDGKFQGQMILSGLASPERLAFGASGALLVYDGHAKEIYLLDVVQPQGLPLQRRGDAMNISFGKFQVDRADAFFVSGDRVNVFDRDNDDTTVFFLTGMFDNSFRGLRFYDGFRNLLGIDDGGMYEVRTDRRLVSQRHDVGVFHFEREHFVLYDGVVVRVYRFRYEATH
jgi:hypothetical protein